MARMVWLVLAVALWMVAGADAARAEERLALVIGNKNYTRDGWMPVIPAENDARDMAVALRGLGFEVVEHTNLDRVRLLSAVQDFGKRVKAMKGGSIVVVYFSGHGVGLPGNDNYLIPVDVGVRSAAEIERDALSLGFLLRQLGEAPNRLNVVVLDACRNDPFTSSGGGVSYGKGVEGFHHASPPEGTILQYAARPGTQARWIEGRDNSLYTAHFKREIAVPGRSLQEALTATEEAVVAEANQREFVQTPWFEGRLSLASKVWLGSGNLAGPTTSASRESLTTKPGSQPPVTIDISDAEGARRVEDIAPTLLICYHPTGVFEDAIVQRARGALEVTINWHGGFAGSKHQTVVAVEVRRQYDGYIIKSALISDTSFAPPDPACQLRDWQDIDNVASLYRRIADQRLTDQQRMEAIAAGLAALAAASTRTNTDHSPAITEGSR